MEYTQTNEDKKMKYNYFYDGRPISAENFRREVPADWEKDVVDGIFSWGYYRAVERD